MLLFCIKSMCPLAILRGLKITTSASAWTLEPEVASMRGSESRAPTRCSASCSRSRCRSRAWRLSAIRSKPCKSATYSPLLDRLVLDVLGWLRSRPWGEPQGTGTGPAGLRQGRAVDLVADAKLHALRALHALLPSVRAAEPEAINFQPNTTYIFSFSSLL